MVVHVQVLSVQSTETTPSLLVSTEAYRFLFNVGDGTQRLCMEHHVRFAKLEHVFLTELRTHTVGGLPGMVLTVSDTGKTEFNVHGPPGIRNYLKATRHFLHRPQFQVKAYEVLPSTEMKKKTMIERKCYEDDEVIVYAMAVTTSQTGTKRAFDRLSRVECDDMDTHISVSYVVETTPQRGKFLLDRVMAFGVPRGKLYGQLHQGKDVTLSDGRLIKASDCVLPSVPAAACVIVSCPTKAHIEALVTTNGFDRYREIAGKSAQVQVEVMFHLGNNEVLHHPKYAEWVRNFGNQARHVLLGHNACAQKTVHRASAKLQAQMHAVFPSAFPSNEKHEMRDAVVPFSRTVPDVTSLQYTPASSDETTNTVAATPKVVLGESMLKFVLSPLARRGFDASSCWPRLDFDEICGSVASSVDIVTKACVEANNMDDDLMDGRITFLGTGCAIPSKYRNVTGMYLELPIDKKKGEVNAAWAGLMLDCGEGSLGQMYRYANGDKKRLQELVDCLKCVWISHNHADHHLGLLRLLSYRNNDASIEPLLVIGPTALGFWLDEYAVLDPTVRGKFSFVENYCFDENDLRFTNVETHAEAVRVRAWLRKTLSISQLECIPVKHAFQAYAVVITFVDGAKLAFSGDCRPSEKLAEKAKSAFLMVHEATFEDDLAMEAKNKAHCTMAEAIRVGRQANVRHLLLTHFSQRYPKMAVLSASCDKSGVAPMQVLTAIDMLSLRFRELRQPHLMEVCTQLMTLDDEEEGNTDAIPSLKAQQERDERKKQKTIERGERP